MPKTTETSTWVFPRYWRAPGRPEESRKDAVCRCHNLRPVFYSKPHIKHSQVTGCSSVWKVVLILPSPRRHVIWHDSVCLSNYLPICPAFCPCVRLSFCPLTHRTSLISLSVCLTVGRSVGLPIHPSVNPFGNSPSLSSSLYVCQPDYILVLYINSYLWVNATSFKTDVQNCARNPEWSRPYGFLGW